MAYKYRELSKDSEDIRLLTLLPGHPRDPIRIKIEHVALPEYSWHAPPFEALSYVWGQSPNKGKVTVTVAGENGQPDSYIEITANLNAALPYLRYRRHARKLWIDGICIDQNNVVEKSYSVKRMAVIYNHAARVLIWLGSEAHNSTNAMKSLRYLGNQVIVNLKQRSMIMAGEITQDEIDNLILRDLEIFLVLLERPWFERLWVQQEAKLAIHAQVVCGGTTCDWRDFRSALFCMWHLSQRIALPADVVDKMNRAYILIGKSAFLLNELIFHGKARKCSDPRDRVYALLGLIGGTERRLEIEPDYTLSIAGVYQDVVKSYLKCLQRLDCIACCEASLDEGKKLDAPSWVPDWEHSRQSQYFHYKRHPATLFAQAQILDKRILSAKGLKVATVKEVIQMDVPPKASSQEIVDRLQAFAPHHLWEKKADKEEIIDAFCRTMMGDHFRERWNPPDAQEAIESECQPLVRAILSGEYSAERHLAEIPTATRYLALVRLYARHRAFLILDDGRFALGPEAIKPEAIIATLVGCKAPLALEPTAKGEYKLLGEVYLDSVVAGQAFLGELPKEYVNVTSYDAEEDTFVDSFLNRSTGKFQREDPRLVGKLGKGYRSTFTSPELRREAENQAALDVMAERKVRLEEFRVI